MAINLESIPAVGLDLKPSCGCRQSQISWDRITRKFVRPNASLLLDPGYDVAAILDLHRWRTYADYVKETKQKHKGSAHRHGKKAIREGFYAAPFAWKLHVPDACEINHSMPVRCGKPMRPAYCKSVEEMGGAPKKAMDFEPENCTLHNTIPWGVFEPKKCYYQGDVRTDAKLLAYIKFKRIGDMALYTQILGHGDYLQYGIMYYLHFSIMEWMLRLRRDYQQHTDGIRYIVYAQYYSGNHGLRQWKRKVLFEPARLFQCQKSQ